MYLTTIIVSAGKGKRFRGKKQFYKLSNKIIVIKTAEKFTPFSDEMIILLPKEDISKWSKKIRSIMKHKNLKILPGGKHRYDSVRIGLENISNRCEIVCIHDAVRPFIKRKDIIKCISTAKKYGSAICAAPATDTIKISDNSGFIERTIDRRKVYLVQTPQIFRRDIIVKAYKQVLKKQHSSNITDDAQIVEMAGQKVKIVPTNHSNIKITTKKDLTLCKSL
ncbi:MAG: 2-C-methyl-D-erythritol 4-phosphate cytidylyltransferase [Elusimicrobia bacterium CG1_02_37_114]|nr:MAG: 2-C-methyl-D-erythritol 4-phosphate cytidylyltransferase [Elusimicrobia bacterium CG1_02_37_114]